MHPLYSVAQIRQAEKTAMSGLPPGTLMRRAGRCAADAAINLIQEPAKHLPVLVLAGPGNNGGDALEAASQLARTGIEVAVLVHDRGPRGTESLQTLEQAKSSGAVLLPPKSIREIISTKWALVIDGLFGIGLARPLEGDARGMAETVSRLRCPVLALDVPSGLDADTGRIVGNDGIAIKATHTLTFLGDKPGLHTCEGRDFAGQVQIASLDIPADCFPSAQMHLNTPDLFSGSLSQRRHNSHKGSYGDVCVVGGARGMSGAVILSARSAAQSGAGRVYACFIDDVPLYASDTPELMCRSAGDTDFTSPVIVAGMGMGGSPKACEILSSLLASDAASLVLDADALNLLSQDKELRQMLAMRAQPVIITPHPLEAARLLGVSSEVVQADRINAAYTLAQRFNAVAILKGSGTVIAHTEGNIAINGTGNPALATAGTGDVLAGVCGALLAQDVPAWEAALAAVWLHGHAADSLVKKGIGPIGLTASELIPAIRAELNSLVYGGIQSESMR